MQGLFNIWDNNKKSIYTKDNFNKKLWNNWKNRKTARTASSVLLKQKNLISYQIFKKDFDFLFSILMYIALSATNNIQLNREIKKKNL